MQPCILIRNEKVHSNSVLSKWFDNFSTAFTCIEALLLQLQPQHAYTKSSAPLADVTLPVFPLVKKLLMMAISTAATDSLFTSVGDSEVQHTTGFPTLLHSPWRNTSPCILGWKQREYIRWVSLLTGHYLHSSGTTWLTTTRAIYWD